MLRWLCLTWLVMTPLLAVGERRVAVVIGHAGGLGERPLRYAHADAERMHRILTTIGGFDAASVLMRDPQVEAVRTALARAAERAEGGSVLVYYSGHARNGELLMGGGKYPIAELRAALEAMGARFKVAILDSCRSGEGIRSKGGRLGPAFDVSAEPPGPRGVAVLASSARDEDSQESDLLGSSFFTHFLASGLAGDADTSGDGRVTLQEAYDYAYGRTVSETTAARAGVQHPTYSYSLGGAGEWWLTDVSRADAILVLPRGMGGSFVVVDDATRRLVADVEKPVDIERKLALPSGPYEVKLRDGDHVRVARLRLGRKSELSLDAVAMSRVALAKNLSKGLDQAGALAEAQERRWGVVLTGGLQGFFSEAARTRYFPWLPTVGLDLESRDWFTPRKTVFAIDLSLGSASLPVVVGGEQVQTRMDQISAGASWVREFGASRLRPSLGGRLSILGVRRAILMPSSLTVPDQHLLTMAPGVVAGLAWEFGHGLSVGLRARASYLLYRTEEELSLGFFDAGLIVRWEP